MDPLQRWRLKWDILMMLMICFVMIVTPFELAFVSAVGWSKNYTPFPNKLISASRRVETPSRHRCASCPSHNEVGGLWSKFEPTRTASSDRDAPRRYTGLFITNWTVNLLFIVDIVFNFLTAVYDPQLNKWLLRFDQIALHYARGWMALDVVSMLPVEYMIKSKQASAIRLLRVFRLMKLAKVSVHPRHRETSPRRSYAVRSSSTTSPSTSTCLPNYKQ